MRDDDVRMTSTSQAGIRIDDEDERIDTADTSINRGTNNTAIRVRLRTIRPIDGGVQYSSEIHQDFGYGFHHTTCW